MVTKSIMRQTKDFFKSLATSKCSCATKEFHSDVDLEKEKEFLKLRIQSHQLTVMEKLFMKAAVVTMETKYHVFPNIAEFWCTITSIFFAFPLLLLSEYKFSELETIMSVFVILSMITATSSFTYHWTLYKIFSSLDAAFATIMVVLTTFALLAKNPTTYPTEDIPSLWIGGLVLTSLIFLKFWENTASTSLIIFALVLPANLFCMLQLGYNWAMINGIIGISCFIIDRKGIAPTHSLWHFFGGIYLYQLGYNLCQT